MKRDASASSVLRNAFASLIGRKLGAILRAVATLQMAAYLGAKGWGLFGVLVAAFDVFRVLTSLGLDTAGVRSAALRQRTQPELIRIILWVKTASCAIGVCVVAVLGLAVPSWIEQRWLLLLLALGLFPQAYAGTLTVRFQAAHAMERLIPVQVGVSAIYLAAVQLLIHQQVGIGGFIALGVVADYLTLWFTWAIGRWTWTPDLELGVLGSAAEEATWPSTMRVVLAGLPLGLVEVIVMIYSRLGIFLLQRSGGVAAVGHYYAAYKIAEPLVVVGGILALSALPVLSRLASQHRIKELRDMFVRYSLRSALLSCTLAAVVSIWSEQVLHWLNPEFAAGAGALSALAWAAAFMFQNQISGVVFYAFGKYHWVAGCAAFNLVVYVTLGLSLIPRLGPTGAGLATLGTEGLNTVITLCGVAWLLHRNGRMARRVPA